MLCSPGSAFTLGNAVDEYRKGPEPSKGGEWIADPTFDQVRSVIGASFAGTGKVEGEPMCDWASDHLDRSWYTYDKHREAMQFGIGFPIGKVMMTKKASNAMMAIVKRDADGSLASAAVIEAHDPSLEKKKLERKNSVGQKIKDSWIYLRTLVSIISSSGAPEAFRDSEHKEEMDHFVAKLEVFEGEIDRLRVIWAPQRCYWYVKMVGVAPEFNGRGYGRELMEKIAELADAQDMPCYLEAGMKNKAFYEKMGYEVVSEMTVADPVDASREPFRGVLMIRRPTQQGPAKQ